MRPDTPNRWLLTAGGAALLALPLFVSLPDRSILMARLHDFGHAPLFGVVALVVLGMLPRPDSWRRHCTAFAIAMACGAGIEVLQSLIGRDAEWSDLTTDGLGAAGALLALAACRRDSWAGSHWRARLVAGLAACVVIILAAAPLLHAVAAQLLRQHRLPALLQASTVLDAYYVSGGGNQVLRRPLPDRWRHPGEARAFWVELRPAAWSGITLLEPAPDWRGYEAVVLSLVNPSTQSLDLTLRIHDARHNRSYSDRYNRSFTLPPEARTEFRVPLAEVAAAPQGRAMDLSRIDGLMLFARDAATRPRVVYLIGIRLE